MKLRLHGTPAECAAATNGCAAPPASTSKTRAAPTRTAAASWSASTSPSTSPPAPARPGGGERLMTGPDLLGLQVVGRLAVGPGHRT